MLVGPKKVGVNIRSSLNYTESSEGLMSEHFVERRHDSFYLTCTRVPLASLVLEFQAGEPAEAIRAHYPTLSLEQVYGAITFYLGNRTEVEADLAERLCEEDEYSKAHPAPMDLKDKFARMRAQAQPRRAG